MAEITDDEFDRTMVVDLKQARRKHRCRVVVVQSASNLYERAWFNCRWRYHY